ncbi:E3 ubiquitin-protein ligase SHPRH-like [Saccostrea echinata]|uniref:E3 ubiquitin-protein ligase SHPRH-like n=1 Tax=Saccostrea echinata TaxID=191078 RepID=UPI002A7EC9A7|nr:E3 ubiquitin-protein ligase SHPRH-like [Saccostrea echinata]
MVKRKGNPQRASEEKQRCLTWNMDTLGARDQGGSMSIINDDDPCLLHEVQQSGTNSSKEKQRKEPDQHIYHFSQELMHDMFNLILKECIMYVPVLSCRKPEHDGGKYFEIGTFKIKITNESFTPPVPSQLPECREYWLYVHKSHGQDLENRVHNMLYFETCEADENEPKEKFQRLFWCAELDLPLQVLKSLSECKFLQCVGHYDNIEAVLHVTVFGSERLISRPAFASEPVKSKVTSTVLKNVIGYFFSLKPPDFSHLPCVRNHDIEHLYAVVKQRHDDTELKISVDVQHDWLRPVLRPYQVRGVKWMLQKERYGCLEENKNEDKFSLHPLYHVIETKDKQTLYYNMLGGSLLRNRPVSITAPPGGLLADEMGLGKTVEVLACIILHPRKNVDPPQRITTLSEYQKSERFESSDVEFTLEGVRKVEEELLDSDRGHDKGHDNGCDNGQLNSLDHSSTSQSLDKKDDVLDADVGDLCNSELSDTTQDVGTYLGKLGDLPTQPLNSESHSMDKEINSPGVSGSVDKQTANNSGSMGTQITKNSGSIDTQITNNSGSIETQISNNTDSSEKIPVSSESSHNNDLLHSNNSVPQTAIESDCSNRDESGGFKKDHCMDVEVHMDVDLVNSVDSGLKGSGDVEKCADDTDIVKILPGDELGHLEEVRIHDHPYMENSQSLNNSKEQVPLQTQQNPQLKSTTKSKRSKSKRQSKGREKPPKEKTPVRQKSMNRFVELVPEDQFRSKNIFDHTESLAPRNFFECICGTANDSRKVNRSRTQLHRVQCVTCGLYQHAECVGYDLQDPFRGQYRCPHCLVLAEPIKSGATLIISPAAISHQWTEEIQKHIKRESLKVFVYNGVNKQRFIQPMMLARQDIVITSYETLRSEINYVDLPHSNSENGRKFRHPKRFMATPSPITAVEWWRICLDEAQMVECTTTKTAEMALRLSAVNRWCVTGTPIQKSIEDLYGLLLFLGVDPYWVKQWWTKLLYEPFCYGKKEAMIDLVSKVMWRTAKHDVLNQINIPKQTEHVHWLTFSPVEDHFYRRQYTISIRDSMKKLDKWRDPTVKLSSLDRATANQLLGPLLRLRQACCHPQAVKGEFLPLHLRRSAMTMEELLESLTKKTRTECEESHRLLIAAFNGLAGWYIINEQFVDAVEMYREVLRSVVEHKDRFRTDDLQQLHAMYNLDEMLQSKPEGVQPTLRDGQLKEQMEELKVKYLTKSRTVVHSVNDQLAPVTQSLQDLQREFMEGQEWWLEVIQLAAQRDIDDRLIDHVKNDLSNQQTSVLSISMAGAFHNVYGLELVMQQRMMALESAYEKLKQALNKVTGEPSQDLINETVECCLRPVEGVKSSCSFCKIHLLFEDYEAKLFSFQERAFALAEDTTEVSSGSRRQGTWADSEMEKALKSVLSFARSHAMDRDLVHYGQTHIEIMDKLKKEFKLLRVLWIECKAHVSSFDELSMATTRLRLRLPDEPKPDNNQLNILEPSELDQHKLKLLSEKTISENELRKKLGQLLYLQNLAKAQLSNEMGENPDLCPICQKELGKEWCVLHCGHCYCLDCIRVLCEQYSFGGRNRLVKCAVCREKTYHSDISYVSTVKSDEDKDVETRVQGSHSTKIVGIIRCLKQIKREDPGAKVLLFSSWTDILNILVQALEENEITFKTLFSGSKFQKNLAAFKSDENITVLLLPIHSGANGLNLIEATYVLLVEPVLNPAQELQAIGRVHRIGQTRPTEVHRFVIRGTIEEKMYKMLKSAEATASSHDTEENCLTVGDLTSLLKEEREEDPGENSQTI